MPRVILDGAHCAELLADMEGAARALIDRLEREPALWTLAPPGKWSGGQHAEHVANSHSVFADLFETAAHEFESGRLAPRPRRGPLQALVVRIFTQGTRFPRGGRAVRSTQPAPAPERSATLARLRGEIARYRTLVERIPEADRERVWVRNPLTPFRWHYTLPEILRVQAHHTRHHAMLVEEIARVT